MASIFTESVATLGDGTEVTIILYGGETNDKEEQQKRLDKLVADAPYKFSSWRKREYYYPPPLFIGLIPEWFHFQFNYKKFIMWGHCLISHYGHYTDFPLAASRIEEWVAQKEGTDYLTGGRKILDEQNRTKFFCEEVFSNCCHSYYHVVKPEVALNRDFNQFPLTRCDKAIIKYYLGKSIKDGNLLTDRDKATIMCGYFDKVGSRLHSMPCFSPVSGDHYRCVTDNIVEKVSTDFPDHTYRI